MNYNIEPENDKLDIPYPFKNGSIYIKQLNSGFYPKIIPLLDGEYEEYGTHIIVNNEPLKLWFETPEFINKKGWQTEEGRSVEESEYILIAQDICQREALWIDRQGAIWLIDWEREQTDEMLDSDIDMHPAEMMKVPGYGKKIAESFEEFVPYVFAYNLLEDKTGQMIDEKLNGLTFKEFQRYWPSIIM